MIDRGLAGSAPLIVVGDEIHWEDTGIGPDIPRWQAHHSWIMEPMESRR